MDFKSRDSVESSKGYSCALWVSGEWSSESLDVKYDLNFARERNVPRVIIFKGESRIIS
jgi:hypothetical protein